MASSQEARLAAQFLQSVFYGFNLISIYHCFLALLFERADGGFRLRRQINKTVLTFVVLLSILGTVTVGLELANSVYFLQDIQTNLDILNEHRRSCQQLLESGYGELPPWTPWNGFTIFGEPILAAQILLGDIVLIARCWTLYNKRWIVVIPSIFLWLGMVACIILSFVLDNARSSSQSNPLWGIFAIGVLTVALNLLTTSLIVWKIWSVDRLVAAVASSSSSGGRCSTSRLGKIMRVLIDSAALYSIFVFAYVITSVFDTYMRASSTLAILIPQITCISFNLIIIRADRNRRVTTSENLSTIRFNQAAFHVHGPTSPYLISTQPALDMSPADGDDVEARARRVAEVIDTREYSSVEFGSGHSKPEKNKEEALGADNNA